MKKGFNQIDLVFSIAIIIFVVFLSIYYSSHFVSVPIEDFKSDELKHISIGLGDSVFKHSGVPDDWEWSSSVVKPGLLHYIYRTPVHLKEWNGTENNGVFVWTVINPDGKAYNSSIIVYDGNNTLDTELKDIVQNDSGFVEEVNVTFNVSVPADGEKLVYIYYSGDNITSVNYASLSGGNNTLNVTAISPEKKRGTSLSKMLALGNMTVSNVRDKIGIKLPFILSFQTHSRTWEYGYNRTGNNLAIDRRKLIYQNSTGHIEVGDAVAYVWR